MKAEKLFVFLCIVVLAMIGAGCHHVVAPAPVVEAPPAPAATLTAVPNDIERGASVDLTWNTKNATSVTIDGIGSVSASGSRIITPKTSTTYHLTAMGAGGAAEASVRITVNAPVEHAPELSDEKLFAKNVKDIFFDFDNYDVPTNEAQIVDSDAAFLEQHPNFTLLIEGHCDDRGSDEYNLALGDSRAAAVRDRLVLMGVSAERISVISFGKERPFCTTEDESCWSQNRRAHFVFKGENRAAR